MGDAALVSSDRTSNPDRSEARPPGPDRTGADDGVGPGGARHVDEPVPWRQLTSREVYRNRWMHLREDTVEMPDGRTTIYGVVSTGHAVGVLAFTDPDTVVLVRQWRYVIGRATWEMPTGSVHPGEDIESAGQRELAEEAGYRAGHLRHLATYDTSKSVMEEVAHLYLATDLVPHEVAPDDTEFIIVRTFPFDEVLAMALDGRIVDGMTLTAVLLADRLRNT